MFNRLVFATISFLMAGPVFAESVGVDFARMPIGCIVHSEYSNGFAQINTYAGKKGNRHLVLTYEGRATTEPITEFHKSYYDSNGHLVRIEKTDNTWLSFSPYRCWAYEGVCELTLTRSSGQVVEFIGKARSRRNKIVSEGIGGQPPEKIYMTFIKGPFNMRFGDYADIGGKARKLVDIRLENCGE